MKDLNDVMSDMFMTLSLAILVDGLVAIVLPANSSVSFDVVCLYSFVVDPKICFCHDSLPLISKPL